jgi:hypothetical protein
VLLSTALRPCVVEARRVFDRERGGPRGDVSGYALRIPEFRVRVRVLG